MKFIFNYKVIPNTEDIVEVYEHVEKAEWYFSHGRHYVKLHLEGSEFEYDHAIDLSNINDFNIENDDVEGSEWEEKSFDFWFSSNEKCRTEPTTEEQKGLLRLGYHFGFQNALKISKELAEKEGE